MAREIAAKVTGGQLREYSGVDTVGELKERMGLTGNYQANVNAEPASLDHELSDQDFVVFTQSVKGGQ